MSRRGIVLCSTLVFLWAATSSHAQTTEATTGQTVAPPHIELIDGVATLEREGQIDRAVTNVPLIPGDRLRTDRGRVEIIFGDGSALYVDHAGDFELMDQTLVRLSAGRVRLVVTSFQVGAGSPRYQIDTPAGSVRIDAPGEYRIALMSGLTAPEVELAVARGVAQLVTEAGAMIVRAGERSLARDGSPPTMPQPFNSARWDAFDMWARQQQAARTGAFSSQYLPPDVQMYAGTFDRYGSWGHDPAYGYVWYPTAAPSGWRPYYNGYWNHVGPHGWTWIGHDPWAWPTHHWGRWGFGRGVWFWIPLRRWAAAWVSWAIAPGYVSWCPLGFDGRPVIGFGFAGRPVIGVGQGLVAGFLHDPWRAWTLLDRRHFGLSRHVGGYALDGRRLIGSSRTPFVVQGAPPVVNRAQARGVAVPRPVMTPHVRALPGQPATVAPAPAPAPAGRPYAVPRGAAPPAAAPPAPMVNPRGQVAPGFSPAYSSPYDRAARVAAERRPGFSRQALPRGDQLPVAPVSPYPPQYQTPVPEPYRARPRAPGFELDLRPDPRGPRPDFQSPRPHFERPRRDGGVIVAPPAGRPAPYPAPYSPTYAVPRAPATPPPSAAPAPPPSASPAPARQRGGAAPTGQAVPRRRG